MKTFIFLNISGLVTKKFKDKGFTRENAKETIVKWLKEAPERFRRETAHENRY